MQKYEAMFFNDKEALEKLIIDLVGKCCEENEAAEQELAEIKEQVDYSYEITASAEFALDCSVAEANAEFTDVKDFREFKAQEDERWVSACDLTEWCEFDFGDMGDLYVNETEISIEFDGVSDTASKEAQLKMEEIYKVQRKEFILNQATTRLEEAKKQIARLQAQIIEDEQTISINTRETLDKVLDLRK